MEMVIIALVCFVCMHSRDLFENIPALKSEFLEVV